MVEDSQTPERDLGAEMNQASEEERWVEEFLRQRWLRDLQEHILRQAWAAEGRIERHTAGEPEFDWVRVNGEDIGGPDDQELSLHGIEAVEMLEKEQPPLVRREHQQLYVLTPAGRGAARARHRRRL
ncbi:MAG: hypothetical protein JSV65_04685 [Armatimonadota bacterium]|nr:MAG: hypothetical protein JSV65_04685 [Armatimonadota bacterium]